MSGIAILGRLSVLSFLNLLFSWYFSKIDPAYDMKLKKCAHFYGIDSWRQWLCESQGSFVCQEKIKPIRGKKSLRLEYTKEQLTFPYFQVWYSYKTPANKTLLVSAKQATMTGFRLSWRIEKEVPKSGSETMLGSKNQNGTEGLENEAHGVLPKYSDAFFSKVVQLARQMRMKNMTRQDIVKETIQQKVQNTIFLQEQWCPKGIRKYSMEKLMVKNLTYKIGELPLPSAGTGVAPPPLGNGAPPPPPPPPPPLSRRKRALVPPPIEIGDPAPQFPVILEDIENGILINAAIDFCSETSRGLFKFFDSLLVSNCSSKELIQTLVNTVLYSEIWERSSKRELYAFYIAMGKLFDLQYGKILLAISEPEELKRMLDLELPFFAKDQNVAEACLSGKSCQEFKNVVKSLGNFRNRDTVCIIFATTAKTGGLCQIK